MRICCVVLVGFAVTAGCSGRVILIESPLVELSGVLGASGGGGGGAGGIVIRNAAGILPAGGARSPSIAPGLQALPLRTI